MATGRFFPREKTKMAVKKDYHGTQGPSGMDRRRYPRYLVEIPLDYSNRAEDTDISTGLTANASEGGLMTFMGERVDVGTVLNVTLLFRSGFSLTCMEAMSQVVWRDDVWKDYVDSYRYGLKFLQTEDEELEKLRVLLENSERQETLYIPTPSKPS